MARVITRRLVMFAAIGAALVAGVPAAAAETTDSSREASLTRAAAETGTADRPMLDHCDSGGLVDRKLQGSPQGVYGGGWMNCFRPLPDLPLQVTVRLTRNGTEVGYDTEECWNRTGCSANTAVVPNPAGSQRWCARVTTKAPAESSWSGTYCRNW